MKKQIFLIMIVLLCIVGGCKKEAYLYQDISARIWLGRVQQIGNNFSTVDSLESSFTLLPAGQMTDTMYVTANLTGITTDYPREFKLEMVAEKSNVVAGDYTLLPAILPAHASIVQVPVVVKKNVAGLDLTKMKANLVFRFVADENFLEGTVGRNEFRLIWSDFFPKPLLWTIRIDEYLGTFSQARYKFILDYFGPLELDKYINNVNLASGLQATLRKLLSDYNSDPANKDKPEGWPYRDDNGNNLTF